MSKSPFFSNEVDLNKVNFSNINYSNNKEYFCISYDRDNPNLYLQSPIFKFIQPITQKNNSIHSFNDLYLFLTPQDSSTFEFIELMNKLEIKSQEAINQHKNNMSVISIIKSCDIDDDQINDDQLNNDQLNNDKLNNKNKCQIKQVVKYLKIKLLDMTQIEYKNEHITINQLNNLVELVNLKLIFEISMAWITKNKVGIYLKPIKIKAVDVLKIADVDFREDTEMSDISNMEQTENIKQIINSQSLMSLGDSAFKTKCEFTELRSNTNTETIQNLNAFIPSHGYNNMQDQLKNELNGLNEIRHNSLRVSSSKETNKKETNKKETSRKETKSLSNNKTSDKDHYKSQQLYSNYTYSNYTTTQNNNSSSISEELLSDNESSSSIEIQNYGRKKKNINNKPVNKPVNKPINKPVNKKIGRPKKDQNKEIIIQSSETSTIKSNDEKNDSIIKLKELINDDDINLENYIQSESESLNFDLEYDN